MAIQTLTIGKQKYVVLPEREFERLRRKAGEEPQIRDEVAEDAMRELNRYKKSGKAVTLAQAKRKLGL